MWLKQHEKEWVEWEIELVANSRSKRGLRLLHAHIRWRSYLFMWSQAKIIDKFLYSYHVPATKFKAPRDLEGQLEQALYQDKKYYYFNIAIVRSLKCNFINYAHWSILTGGFILKLKAYSFPHNPSPSWLHFDEYRKLHIRVESPYPSTEHVIWLRLGLWSILGAAFLQIVRLCSYNCNYR